MPPFFLHAHGTDRTGIVAALSGALARIGCNLEDSRMTLLRGQFAIMVVLDAPGVDNGWLIEHALEPVAAELGLVVTVRALGSHDTLPQDDAALDAEPAPDPALLSVSVHGADHPGIVSRVAAEIAAKGCNIVDLATRLVGGGYVLLASVEVGTATSVSDLADALRLVGEEVGVQVVVAPSDADVL